MNLKEMYNRIAEDWVTDHAQDNWWQESTDVFLSMLPPGASVLDVGCGGGIKSAYIAERGYDVTGIDFSEKMIDIAKRSFPSLQFEVVDLYDFDAYQKTFDGIFVQAVLLHIPKRDIQAIIKSLAHKLDPEGLLYVAVKGMKPDGIQEKTITERDYGYEYERFFSFYTVDEMKGYFQEAGLTVLMEKQMTGESNWIQIIGKK